MKKRSILVLLVAALTIGNAVPAAAAPYGCGRNPQCGQNYVDIDGDGVCDNFVDANGDGINDNCPGYGNGRGCGNGPGYGNGQGCGNGPGYGNVQGKGQGQYKVPTASSTKLNTINKAATKKKTIKKVQKRLNKIGYNCGKANGIMNKKTKNALRKFKKAKGLKANISIDGLTLRTLGISK